MGHMGGMPADRRRKRSMTPQEFEAAVADLKAHPAQPLEVRRHFLVDNADISSLADASRRWLFARQHGFDSE